MPRQVNYVAARRGTFPIGLQPNSRTTMIENRARPKAVSFDEAHAAAPGVLLILNDVLHGAEQEFNRWYQQQQLSECLDIPGFQRGRRYRAVDGQPAWMTIYDCSSLDVLSSSAYKARLANPTTWTRKLMPNFRNMLRSACRESWAIGSGTGGSAIVVHCSPIRGREADARRFVQTRLGPTMMKSSSMARMALWESDPETGECTARNAVPWVLFIESIDLAHTALSLHAHILSCGSVETGLLIGTWSRYQLVFEQVARPAPAPASCTGQPEDRHGG